MQRLNQNVYDFNDSVAEPLNEIKPPKNNKTKMLKDLNKASNTYSKSDKNVKASTSSRDKDLMMKKQRSRADSQQKQLGSLLERVTPGAKIRRGQWKDSKLHGQVVIEYDNGNIFEGKYHNNLRVEGKMIYKEANCQYEGFFFGQRFSGYGKLTYYEGRVIEGEWDSTGLVGNCTITYPNEDVYYGPVDQKMYKHGQGYLFLKNGYKYIGSFRRGSIWGIGSYFKDQKLIVKGAWQKGKLTKELSQHALSEETELEDTQVDGQAPQKQNTNSLLRADLSKSAFMQILKANSAKKPTQHAQNSNQNNIREIQMTEQSLYCSER